MKQKGFTLFELIVVMMIIAILTAVSVVGYNGFVQRAKDTKSEEMVNQIKLDLYLETSSEPYMAALAEGDVYVFFDYENDRFVFESQSMPDASMAVAALEDLFEDTFGTNQWEVNVEEVEVGKDEIIMEFVSAQLEIVYLSANGGIHTWEPATILAIT
jgi:prepilin-type N-terminal cleavage/methylation domain-containing protein